MHIQVVQVFTNKALLFVKHFTNPCEHTIFLLWILKHTYLLQMLRKLTNSFWQIGNYSVATWHWEIYTVPNSILYWRKCTKFSHCRSSLYTSQYHIWGKAFLFLFFFYNALITTSHRKSKGKLNNMQWQS